jgi:hypothetical protein
VATDKNPGNPNYFYETSSGIQECELNNFQWDIKKLDKKQRLSWKNFLAKKEKDVQ